jgi:hypothetical protein
MTTTIEYPSLKEAADQASRAAQRAFMVLNVSQLFVLAATALVAGWTPSDPVAQRKIAIGVAVLMFLALGITTILRQTKLDDRWFRCRALAENIKSAVWYYVMSAANTPETAESAYLGQIKQLQTRLDQVAKEVALQDSGGPLITSWMLEAQQLVLDQKLLLYREKRLNEQSAWYLRNSKENTKREKLWFAAILLLEFLAVGYAALHAWQMWEFNAIGMLAATSAGIIAWMQTKRFSDLGVSYGIAAGDLRLISEARGRASTQEEIQQLVNEVETAVSREHSIWLARRTV